MRSRACLTWLLADADVRAGGARYLRRAIRRGRRASAIGNLPSGRERPSSWATGLSDRSGTRQYDLQVFSADVLYDTLPKTVRKQPGRLDV